MATLTLPPYDERLPLPFGDQKVNTLGGRDCGASAVVEGALETVVDGALETTGSRLVTWRAMEAGGAVIIGASS